MSITTGYNNLQQQRNIDRYREKATTLFQKLQHLQENSELIKSQKQRSMVFDFNQTEKKVVESSKTKEAWYQRVLEMVKAIEGELADQQSEEQKCRRSLKNWVESVERELNQNFERLEKEKTKSEAALQRLVESRVQSFILKNKNVWNQGTLISKDPYVEEVDFLNQEYKKFLGELQRECEKLKKDTFASIRECTRLAEAEMHNGQEEQITAVMKSIHMDITAKLKSLREQRERTEERVISMLEKVVSSVSK